MKIKEVLTIIAMIMIVAVLLFAIWYQNKPPEEEEFGLALVTFHTTDSSTLEITCEVVSTSNEKARGLSNRDELPEDRGMLFVFDPPENVSFWMKDTEIPLDIIFIYENGTVQKVVEADPEPGKSDSELTLYKSDAPAKWVVEINQGLSAEYGIDMGTEVTIKLLD